jgi:recombination protein RecA
MERIQPTGKTRARYFSSPESVVFFSSGCEVLNQVLGGGWAAGRIVGMKGDSSTGKTLLAIEACANFLKHFKGGMIRYREVEAAFDLRYAERIGLPVEEIEYNPTNLFEEVDSVEKMYKDLKDFCAKVEKEKAPAGLYVLDSLDALSDEAELAREINDPTYGSQKAKQMSQMFRRIKHKAAKSNVTVMIISQIRDKIGVTFGERTSTSGGKALKFYCSQILNLTEIKKLRKTIKGVERTVGTQVKATCTKSKVGRAYRDCQFPILMEFGIDDNKAALMFLNEVNMLDMLGIKKKDMSRYLKKMEALPDHDFRKKRRRLAKVVRKAWHRVEKMFDPPRRKY